MFEKVDAINSNDVKIDESLIPGYIPEPPSVAFDENIILNALGEPTLESLGLACSWWPTQLVQWMLELIHVHMGLSWIGSIVFFTLALRICLFPITIIAQRNGAKMKKISPTMNRLRERMEMAKSTGSVVDSKYLEKFFAKGHMGIF